MWHDDKAQAELRTRFVQSEAERADGRRRLEAVRAEVLREVPGAGIASDQPYRLADLAIDFCEDVPPLPRAEIERIVAIFERAWRARQGELDPRQRLVRRLRQAHHQPADDGASCSASISRRDARRYVFSGDSPNDAPMFGFFPNAVGVANVRDFADRHGRTCRAGSPRRARARASSSWRGADRGADREAAMPPTFTHTFVYELVTLFVILDPVVDHPDLPRRHRRPCTQATSLKVGGLCRVDLLRRAAVLHRRRPVPARGAAHPDAVVSARGLDRAAAVRAEAGAGQGHRGGGGAFPRARRCSIGRSIRWPFRASPGRARCSPWCC